MQFLLSFLLLFISAQTIACSCGPLGKITKRDIQNVGEAFIGTIISIEEDDSNYTLTATFEVTHYLKGKAHKTEMTVTTSNSGASCGLSFKEGQKWYIFAHYSGDELYAGLCGRSFQLSQVSFQEKRHIFGRNSYRKDKRRFRKDKKALLKYDAEEVITVTK